MKAVGRPFSRLLVRVRDTAEFVQIQPRRLPVEPSPVGDGEC